MLFGFSFGVSNMTSKYSQVYICPVQAFVDSGAQSTIISKSCADRCGYVPCINRLVIFMLSFDRALLHEIILYMNGCLYSLGLFILNLKARHLWLLIFLCNRLRFAILFVLLD